MVNLNRIKRYIFLYFDYIICYCMVFGIGEPKKEEKKEVKNSTVQIVSSGVLPSTDIIDKISDNKQIPADLRKLVWHKDPVHASLTSLTNEGIRKLKHEMEVVDQVEELFTPEVYFYTPGENVDKEIALLKFHIVYSQALENSNNEEGTPVRDKALASTNLTELKQGDTRREQPKPATGLKKLLGIG
jgi:hypothetical protein